MEAIVDVYEVDRAVAERQMLDIGHD